MRLRHNPLFLHSSFHHIACPNSRLNTSAFATTTMTKSTTTAARPAWTKPILHSQRAILDLHSTTFTWQERPIHLPNGNVVNVVVAQPKSAAPSDAVLLLLHGWGAGLAYYARALPYLAPSFAAVYLVDLPGMAASSRTAFPRHNRDASLRYFLDDLRAMYAHLRQQDAVFKQASARHVAAHSLGAYVAAEWLIQSPGCFNSLALVSPVGVPARPVVKRRVRVQRSVQWGFLRALWRAGFTPQDALRVLPATMGRKYCARYIESRYHPVDGWLPKSTDTAATGDKQEDGDADGEMQLMIEYCYAASVAPAASERALSSILEPGAWAVVPLQDRLHLLDVPCLFIYGDRDWMDWKGGRTARERMNVPTKLVRVRHADHNVFVDNPQAFAAEIVSATETVDERGTF